MSLRFFIFFSFMLVAVQATMAQSDPAGTWKGTSICQVKNSPCHDEQAVYHISKANGKNSFQIAAYKIVDGKEDFMGDLNATFDPAKELLVCIDTDHNARWEFNVKGKIIKGTLMVKGQLYRIIDLKKTD